MSAMLFGFATPSMATPTPAPTASPVSGQPTQAEFAFIARVANVLLAEYPTVGAAEAAGYIQITDIGADGTAIYFDRRYAGIDPLHPNFLWYDRNANLVGLDYEYPQSTYSKAPIALFPVAADRWSMVHDHVHFSYRVGNGPIHLGHTRSRPNLRALNITAAELAADNLLPAGASLVWAGYHPACWDLGFWLIPNPNGAFAEKNASVP